MAMKVSLRRDRVNNCPKNEEGRASVVKMPEMVFRIDMLVEGWTRRVWATIEGHQYATAAGRRALMVDVCQLSRGAFPITNGD